MIQLKQIFYSKNLTQQKELYHFDLQAILLANKSQIYSCLQDHHDLYNYYSDYLSFHYLFLLFFLLLFSQILSNQFCNLYGQKALISHKYIFISHENLIINKRLPLIMDPIPKPPSQPKPQPYSQQLTDFISLVPKHFRKYMKIGIFMIPIQSILPNYHTKKSVYLEEISSTKQSSTNTMHKYTSVQPISPTDVAHINSKIAEPLAQYYSTSLKQYSFNPSSLQYHGGFAITYNQGHKGLALHTDDSAYTVNLCLENKAEGNEVVFCEAIEVEMVEGFACVHAGGVPHRTEELRDGERVNVVLWYK